MNILGDYPFLNKFPPEIGTAIISFLPFKNQANLAITSKYHREFIFGELRRQLGLESREQAEQFVNGSIADGEKTFEDIEGFLRLREKPAGERTRDDFIAAGMLTKKTADYLSENTFAWLNGDGNENKEANLTACFRWIPADYTKIGIPYLLDAILEPPTLERLKAAEEILSGKTEIDIKIDLLSNKPIEALMRPSNIQPSQKMLKLRASMPTRKTLNGHHKSHEKWPFAESGNGCFRSGV